jgi:hypothetical protein
MAQFPKTSRRCDGSLGKGTHDGRSCANKYFAEIDWRDFGSIRARHRGWTSEPTQSKNTPHIPFGDFAFVLAAGTLDKYPCMGPVPWRCRRESRVWKRSGLGENRSKCMGWESDFKLPEQVGDRFLRWTRARCVVPCYLRIPVSSTDGTNRLSHRDAACPTLRT